MHSPALNARTLIAVTVIAAICAALFARKEREGRSTALAQHVCQSTTSEIASDARRSVDTISRLRDRTQEVTSLVRTHDLVVIRTQDTNPLASHDGGKVSFDCNGRIRLVWLDGG
jgi:type II secretory pathway component PulK